MLVAAQGLSAAASVLQPTQIMTHTGAYSDVVFGLLRLPPIVQIFAFSSLTSPSSANCFQIKIPMFQPLLRQDAASSCETPLSLPRSKLSRYSSALPFYQPRT